MDDQTIGRQTHDREADVETDRIARQDQPEIAGQGEQEQQTQASRVPGSAP
jgi:hypothetical protein